mgnify:CR=1 FL=1
MILNNNDIRIVKTGLYNTKNFYPKENYFRHRTLQNFEIEYYTSYNGKTMVDGKKLHLGSQSIFLGKPNQCRSGSPNFSCYFIHLEINPESKYYQQLMNCPNAYSFISKSKYFPVFETMHYYRSVKLLSLDEDVFYAKVLELLFYLSEDSKLAYNLTAKKTINNAILTAIKFITDNYDKHLTLNTLSKKFNYSKNYFQTLFKSTTGYSPQEYITNIRIEKAKMFLSNPDIPLTDVSAMSGFSSASYFNVVFKSKCKTTPAAYRKNCIGLYEM